MVKRLSGICCVLILVINLLSCEGKKEESFIVRPKWKNGQTLQLLVTKKTKVDGDADTIIFRCPASLTVTTLPAGQFSAVWKYGKAEVSDPGNQLSKMTLYSWAQLEGMEIDFLLDSTGQLVRIENADKIKTKLLQTADSTGAMSRPDSVEVGKKIYRESVEALSKDTKLLLNTTFTELGLFLKPYGEICNTGWNEKSDTCDYYLINGNHIEEPGKVSWTQDKNADLYFMNGSYSIDVYSLYFLSQNLPVPDSTKAGAPHPEISGKGVATSFEFSYASDSGTIERAYKEMKEEIGLYKEISTIEVSVKK